MPQQQPPSPAPLGLENMYVTVEIDQATATVGAIADTNLSGARWQFQQQAEPSVTVVAPHGSASVLSPANMTALGAVHAEWRKAGVRA